MALVLAVGPGAALGPCGGGMAKGTGKDVSFLACSGLSRGP